MLTLGLGKMILSVWYRCPPWSWSSSSSVMYSTSSSSSAIAWPCTAVSPVMICKFRQDLKFIESRWNEIKRVLETLYLMLEARTLNRWEFSKSPIVWGNHRNKETIRRVSTNQRVWNQVNKQTQLVPWMEDRAQREKQGKWKGDRGFHKEKKEMKGRHRTGARGWETRVDTWTNDVASSSQAESEQREEWKAACKLRKKKQQQNNTKTNTKTTKRMKSRVQIQKQKINTKTIRRRRGHVQL